MKDEIYECSFLKLSFPNKGLDAINLGNNLHQKSVKSKTLSSVELLFPIDGFRLTRCRSFSEHIS
jgi:hypothetical protein